MNLNITEHAMIVNVHLGIWTGAKTDKGAADETASRNNAQAGSVNVIKYLVPKEVIKPVETARNSVRTHFFDRTLPWKDNGDRLLPRKMYQTFIDEHSPLEQAFYDSVNTFMLAYAEVREKAAFNLGDLFAPEDYPHPDDVRAKFYCRVDLDGISDANDFRVSLSKDAIAIIKQQIEETTTTRIFAAQQDVWERIEKTVVHFAGRLAAQMEDVEEGKRRPPFHQSTIDNLIHLVNALPALNIIGDPNMKTLGRRLHGLLTTYNDANTLKGKPDVCAIAHDEIQSIIEEMSGYSAAFEGQR